MYWYYELRKEDIKSNWVKIKKMTQENIKMMGRIFYWKLNSEEEENENFIKTIEFVKNLI